MGWRMGVGGQLSENRRRMLVAIGWSPEVLLNLAVGRIARCTLDALRRCLVGRWLGRDALVGVFAPVLNAGFKHFSHDAF